MNKIFIPFALVSISHILHAEVMAWTPKEIRRCADAISSNQAVNEKAFASDMSVVLKASRVVTVGTGRVMKSGFYVVNNVSIYFCQIPNGSRYIESEGKRKYSLKVGRLDSEKTIHFKYEANGSARPFSEISVPQTPSVRLECGSALDDESRDAFYNYVMESIPSENTCSLENSRMLRIIAGKCTGDAKEKATNLISACSKPKGPQLDKETGATTQ